MRLYFRLLLLLILVIFLIGCANERNLPNFKQGAYGTVKYGYGDCLEQERDLSTFVGWLYLIDVKELKEANSTEIKAIIIKSSKKVEINDTGKYQLELPKGEYQFQIPNRIEYISNRFKIEEGKVIREDIELFWCVLK